ncbi:MAG: LuxR C-terminal-related transcriptional regulator [Sphingomonas taxi]
MTDLPGAAALTAAERRILGMLAEGHTAKTIAAAMGISVNAVNERLREARRKTGAASSRELARRLAAQEIRDNETGMAGPAAPADGPSHDGPHRAARRWRKGLIPMSLLLAAGLAGALATGAAIQSGPAGAHDPLIGDLVADRGAAAGDLYATLRAEDRDAPWATTAETALLNRFGALPGVARLRATCGATLCEVAGVLKPGAASGKALLAVQDVALHGLRDLGFADVATFTVGGAAIGGGTPFVAYPRRLPADVPHVLTTVPAVGARIAPGAMTLSVTFDRPMRPGSYSFVRLDRGAYPLCDDRPRQSADGRTFTMACRTAPDTAYTVGFNSAQFHNFVSAAGGVPAEPAVLAFTTRR